jgi:Icc-related predicted phosphoesterase
LDKQSWGKQSSEAATGVRIVYAADLHSDVAQYEQLAELARREEVSALILGGDLCSHTWEPAEQVQFVTTFLSEWLRRVDVPVYAIPGNVDWPPAYAAMQALARAGLLRLLRAEPVQLEHGLFAIGYPYVPPTPFRQKFWERRDRATDRVTLRDGSVGCTLDGTVYPLAPDALNHLPSIEDDLTGLTHLPEAIIAVIHSPPYGGALDVARDGRHAGSRALAAWIAREQPLLALHGHIHESPAVSGRWAEWRGRTLCINPGRGEALHAIVFDTTALPHSVQHTVYGPLLG